MELKKIKYQKENGKIKEGLFLHFYKKGYIEINTVTNVFIEKFGKVIEEKEIGDYNAEYLIKPEIDKK